MLFESNFYEVLFVTLIAGLILTIAYKFWVGVKTDEVDKAFLNFKISIVSTGILCMILLLLLPTPSFFSFSIQTVNDVQSNEEVIAYLQNYEIGLNRITQVLYFFIFIFVWGFLSSVYYVTRVFNKIREEELSTKVKIST